MIESIDVLAVHAITEKVNRLTRTPNTSTKTYLGIALVVVPMQAKIVITLNKDNRLRNGHHRLFGAIRGYPRPHVHHNRVLGPDSN